MAHAYNLWLEYPADWRPLRDFFYEACKCSHFWTSPMTDQRGPPDGQEREHYAVHNEYNLISFGPPLLVDKPSVTHDVVVTFTLNKFDRWEQWQHEVIDSSIRWLARSAGDALLDWDLLPILGRKGVGPIVVNDLAHENPSQRVLDARRSDYQAFIGDVLRREGLVHGLGPLLPIDSAQTPQGDSE